jgi:hypothetical protein
MTAASAKALRLRESAPLEEQEICCKSSHKGCKATAKN